jgi:uncharacterized protein (DUF983 family)
VGRLFERGLRLHASCAECGLVFRREQGAMTGSMYLSAAVTELFAVVVIAAVWFATDWLATGWGLALSLAFGLPLVGAFCYAFQPYSMGLWVAVEYLTDVGNREAWVRPRPVSEERERRA